MEDSSTPEVLEQEQLSHLQASTVIHLPFKGCIYQNTLQILMQETFSHSNCIESVLRLPPSQKMSCKTAGGIATLVILYFTKLCFAQELLVSPQNTTVFLGQLPSPSFTCVTRGGLPGWWVNGVRFEELPVDSRTELQDSEVNTDEGNTALTLTVPAIAKYNGTMIQCRLFSFTGTIADESENVQLFIKGVPVLILSSENNIVFIPIITNVRFSLDVTIAGTSVRYSYNVIEQNQEIIFCVGCTTETYPYTLKITQPCYQYTFMSPDGTTSATGYVLNATVVEPGIEAISNNVTRVIFGAFDKSVAGCHYEVEKMTACVVSSPSDQQSYIDLCANAYYAFRVSITDDSGGSAQTTLQFSTFDVQEVQTTTDSNGLIQVTGEFITNSTARGMFIVLESEDGSPDVFRALLRQDSGPLLTSTIDNVPPSTYQLFAYDLEQNLEVGASVAYPQIYQENGHPTTSIAELVSTPTFAFLKNATINVTGSTIKAVCKFKEGTEGASCVLVYRQYGNETLVVVENSQQNNAEMIVTMTEPNNYTFAVFGKNSSYFNEQPFVTWPTSITTPDNGGSETSSINVPGVVISVILMITGLSMILIVVIAAIYYLLKRKKIPSKDMQVSSKDMQIPSKDTQIPSKDKDMQIPSKDKDMQIPSKDKDVQIPSKDYSEPKVLYTPRASEYMMSKLESFAVQWKRIAQLMRFDRQKIRKIATTSGTDRERLQQCINTWIDSDKKKPSPISSLIRMLISEFGYFANRWREIAEKMEIKQNDIYEITSYKWTDEECLHRCVMVWVTDMSPSIDKYSDIYSELVMSKLGGFVVQWRKIAEKMGLHQINEIPINGTDEECLRQCVRMWVTGSQSNSSPITSFIELLSSELEYFAGQWFEITEAVKFNEEQVDDILRRFKKDKERLQHSVKIWVTEFTPSSDQFAKVYSGLMISKIGSFLILWKRIAEAMEFTSDEIAEIATNQTDTSWCLKQCVQIWAKGPQVKPSPIRAFLGVFHYELKFFSVQWKQMARAMGIGYVKINEINANSRTDEKCVEKCVDIWITQQKPSTEEFATVYSGLLKSKIGSFIVIWKKIADSMEFTEKEIAEIATNQTDVSRCLIKCAQIWATGPQEKPSPIRAFLGVLNLELIYFAVQWEQMARAMGIRSDEIREIDANSRTDEKRVEKCVCIWITKLVPSTEKFAAVYSDLFMSRLESFAVEWKTIAESMEFDEHELKTIASQYRTNKQRLGNVVKIWAKGAQEGPSPIISFTNMFLSKLKDFTSQWRKIAGKMGIDMSLVNEIASQNDTDEDRLLRCIGIWCTRMKPSPQQLSVILNELKNNGGGPFDQSSVQL